MDKISSFFLLIMSTMSFNMPAECSNILVVSNIPSVSHSMWYTKLVKLLLNHGHQVVFLDVEPKTFDHQNCTHYHLEDAYAFFHNLSASIESGAVSMESIVENYSIIENIQFITNPFDEVLGCRNRLFGKGFQQFLKDYKNRKFDLILYDVGCLAFYGLTSYFNNVPSIVATPFSDPIEIVDLSAGVYDNPSYVPMLFTLYEPKMTFVEKLLNCFYKIYYEYEVYFKYLPNQQELAEQVFGKSVGDIKEHIRNVAVVMYTDHPALFGAKPLPPSVISLAGVHIDPPNPLPAAMKKFMDEAKDGVIYFSMGSNLKSVIMSEKNKQIFMNVFKDLPQRIVWKLEVNDTSNIPPNVYVSKWMPQNDILAHPNVRCFISHGGLIGVQEAVYHGVPILGMPIVFDQVSIIKRLEKQGVAVHLSYPKLSNAYFKEKLNKILLNSYLMKMKEKSRVFRDNPLTPKERFMYWVEYVLRHPSELHYLKSTSIDLTWYQRTLLDIALFALLALVVVVFILLKIIVCVKSFICPHQRKSKAD